MAKVEGITIDTSVRTARTNSGYNGLYSEVANTVLDSLNRSFSQLSNVGDSDGTGIIALIDGTNPSRTGAVGLSVVQYNDLTTFSDYFKPGTVSSPLDQITGDVNVVGSNYINIGLGSPEAISNTLNSNLNIPLSESLNTLKRVSDNVAEISLSNVEATIQAGFGIKLLETNNRVVSTFKQLTNSFSGNLFQDIALKNDNTFRNDIRSLGVNDEEVVDQILTLMMDGHKTDAINLTLKYLEENVYVDS